MGLEPTTFCMASARDVRASSRPFAQSVLFAGSSPERANASEPERTPNLAILATASSAVKSAPAAVSACAWGEAKATRSSAMRVAGCREDGRRDRPVARVGRVSVATRADERERADAIVPTREASLRIEQRKGVGKVRAGAGSHPPVKRSRKVHRFAQPKSAPPALLRSVEADRSKFERVGAALAACEEVARVIGRPFSAAQAESRSDGAWAAGTTSRPRSRSR
jgi:hypothetical protein